MTKIRSPICTVVGHVDHGKSSLLDKIRGTAIVQSEAGRITQAIGASIIPLHIIKKITGSLLDSIGQELTVPGLLFIDTPGHAAFTSLRKRGGSLADIAILIVDINDGFKPQTIEAVEILKAAKTPFIVAVNKIDLIRGWEAKDQKILESISKQTQEIVGVFEGKMYDIVAQLAQLELNAERFDRVSDYTKQIAMVPISAMTGEGIPELLMVMTGLAQKYLESCLQCEVDGPAKGTILEVKEEKGLGTTVDVIIYDGTLKVNDQIVIGSINEPIVTKVKALLEPKPLAEMMDKKAKYQSVREVHAATGVKISAPNLKEVIAGTPIQSLGSRSIDEVKAEVQKEVDEIIIETDKIGLVIKADTLGSLEALILLLKEKDIPVKRATVGDITKKDIVNASANYDDNPLLSAVLGFNVEYADDLSDENVKVLTSTIIYQLIDNLEEWQETKKKSIEMSSLNDLVRPFKFHILRDYVFRQSNPAVVGVDILLGTARTNSPLMNAQGKTLSTVKGIQADQKSVDKAEKGKQVAISMSGVMVGRQINEGDIIYSGVPEEDFKKMKELKEYLTKEECELLKEIAIIMRKNNSFWGV